MNKKFMIISVKKDDFSIFFIFHRFSKYKINFHIFNDCILSLNSLS